MANPDFSGQASFEAVPPVSLDFEKGLMFFHAYMYGPLQGKLRFYASRDVSITTVAIPSDWEVFASILVGEPGTQKHSGVDLQGFEVKSAKSRSAFEYQYHRSSWAEKLDHDAEVGHLFFAHDNNLREVELRYVHGSQMASTYFERWHEECPYPTSETAQRYRKSIPYGWVHDHGILLMRLMDGEVVT
jgi:hypothetical protein